MQMSTSRSTKSTKGSIKTSGHSAVNVASAVEVLAVISFSINSVNEADTCLLFCQQGNANATLIFQASPGRLMTLNTVNNVLVSCLWRCPKRQKVHLFCEVMQ